MNRYWITSLFTVLIASFTFMAQSKGQSRSSNRQIRLNEIQVIGSHNSYHAGLDKNEASLLKQRDPNGAASLDYRHPSLDLQLSRGVRQLELDVWGDSKGGLFANPTLLRMVAEAGMDTVPFDPTGLLKYPGYKVFHIQDIDFRSNCEPFKNCLTVILNWSKAHRGHLPLFILIENKDERLYPDFQVAPEPFTPKNLDAMDAEILSVFTRNHIITPDDVRGQNTTLENAILSHGWPTLNSSRGKVMFLLYQKNSRAAYVQGHPSLKGRVMFTNADPGSPDAAFVDIDDPFENQALIPTLVRKGYLVRTRTDADLVEPRHGDFSRRDAAFATGAQLLSTDFPFDEAEINTHYAVNFPEGTIARCNPLLKVRKCVSIQLESKSSVVH